MCSWCADNPRIIHMLRINSSNDGILFNQRNVEPGTRRRSFGGGCNLDDLVGKVQECLQKFQFVSSFHPLNSIFFTSSQTLGPHFRPFWRNFRVPQYFVMLISSRSSVQGEQPLLDSLSFRDLLESKVFWMFTTYAICPMIDLHLNLGHPLRMQREQLYRTWNFSGENMLKLYFLIWIVTVWWNSCPKNWTFHSSKVKKVILRDPKASEKVCFLEHYFKDRTIVLEEKMPCKDQELRPMHLGRRGDKHWMLTLGGAPYLVNWGFRNKGSTWVRHILALMVRCLRYLEWLMLAQIPLS